MYKYANFLYGVRAEFLTFLLERDMSKYVTLKGL